MVKVTILGSGTSQGVPVIGCDCVTCSSNDPKDNRLRSSILISDQGTNILIDAGPDLRQQMLSNNVKSLHGIFLTHEHNDHVVGLDDIRPFNFRQNMDMPIYALERVIKDINIKFGYIFNGKPYPGLPKIECKEIVPNQEIKISPNLKIKALEVMHGNLPILGYRIKNFAYITDASFLNEESMLSLMNLEVLVINALQYRKHYSHYTLDECLEVIGLLNPKMSYLTHMSHDLGEHDELSKKLPPNVKPAYDGMIIEF